MVFPEGTRTKTGKLGMIKSGAFVIAAAAGADMLPVRIIYGTKDGKMHLFCKIRIVFGEAIPAEDLQIKDQSHKMAELRRMKNRLRDELEQLLADNAFTPQIAENPAPAVDVPETTDKPQLPKETHNMQIIRAKTAGFCFGVDRAVKLTYDLLAQGRKVATLGPLIHNAQVVADLEEKAL